MSIRESFDSIHSSVHSFCKIVGAIEAPPEFLVSINSILKRLELAVEDTFESLLDSEEISELEADIEFVEALAKAAKSLANHSLALRDSFLVAVSDYQSYGTNSIYKEDFASGLKASSLLNISSEVDPTEALNLERQRLGLIPILASSTYAYGLKEKTVVLFKTTLLLIAASLAKTMGLKGIILQKILTSLCESLDDALYPKTPTDNTKGGKTEKCYVDVFLVEIEGIPAQAGGVGNDWKFNFTIGNTKDPIVITGKTLEQAILAETQPLMEDIHCGNCGQNSSVVVGFEAIESDFWTPDKDKKPNVQFESKLCRGIVTKKLQVKVKENNTNDEVYTIVTATVIAVFRCGQEKDGKSDNSNRQAF